MNKVNSYGRPRFSGTRTSSERMAQVVLRGVLVLVIWAPISVDAEPIISAPFVTVGVGNTFTISVSITGATELTSWQFDLAFDPVIVQANEVTEGPFMSAFGLTLFGPGVIDNGTGLISLVTNAYVDLPPNPSGDGVLANIDFTALVPGVSPLTFSNVFLNLADQGFAIENGQVTVNSPVSEPTTLGLLMSGLGLLGMLAGRRRRDEF